MLHVYIYTLLSQPESHLVTLNALLTILINTFKMLS